MTPRLWLLGVGAAVVAGLLARVACLGAEFWLDEIWSWDLARAAATPFDIFFQTKHDNNHHLNTLYLYFCPDGVWWGWYRLHSVAAGVLSIVMAAKVARRWGRAEAVVAAWLMAGCSWLVMASAEARGYALAILFALVAFDALWSYLDTRSGVALAIYWLATLLGFLSHLTFLLATIGFVVWSLRRFGRERQSAGDEVRRFLITHAAPGIAVALFYLVAIRGMEKGGGPPASTFEVLGNLIGTGMGGMSGWWSLPWVVAAVVLFVVGVRRLIAEGSDVWVFFVACCVAAPGVYLVAQPPYLFERYFFIPLTFFLLLAAKALVAFSIRIEARRASEAEQNVGINATPSRRGLPASLARRAAFPALTVTALVAAYLAGNAVTVWRFVEAGRGQFHEALEIVADTDHGYSRITGDHHFRVQTYVYFYRKQLYPTHTMVYLEPGRGVPDWYFVHRLDEKHPPGDEVRDEDGTRYDLVKAFPSRGPGAWGWFLYSAKERDVGK